MTNNGKRDLISIIVPVYNTADYVYEAIVSIANQTYDNIEIVVIDDGSSDSSDEICAKLAKADKRIRVMKQQNAGVSAARNKGLSVAKGKYIVFVDSDDVIHPRMIEMLHHNLVTTGSDVSICGYTMANTDGSIEFPVSDEHFDARRLSPQRVILDILYAKGISGNISGKMYSAKKIQGQRFSQDIYYAEDVLFSISVLAQVKQVCMSSAPLYYYRVRPESAMSLPFSSRRMTALKAYELMQDIFNTRPMEYRAARSRLFMEAIGIMERMPLKDNTADADICMNIIKNLRHEVLYGGNVKITYKLYALVSFFGAAFMQHIVKEVRSIRPGQ